MSVIALALLAQAAYPAAPLDDPALAAQRGGFRLPGGIDVALSVQTQTLVDGAVVLRTVFRADNGPPTLTAYVPRAGETVAGEPTRDAAAPTGLPVITYDSRNGLRVTAPATGPAVHVAGGSATPLPAGLQEATAGTRTDLGTVSEASSGALRSIGIDGADLSIRHLAGGAFGSVIANSGSDRAIDTQTTIAIDLGNAGPDVIGSAMLRAIEVASAAMRSRM